MQILSSVPISASLLLFLPVTPYTLYSYYTDIFIIPQSPISLHTLKSHFLCLENQILSFFSASKFILQDIWRVTSLNQVDIAKSSVFYLLLEYSHVWVVSMY